MLCLERFFSYRHDLHPHTKTVYSNAVKQFEQLVPTPFETVYLDEAIVTWVLDYLSVGIEPSTYNKNVRCYKRLAKWLYDPDDLECPKVWRKVKFNKIDWEKKLRDKWLSEDEVYRMIDVADNPQDKAVVGVGIEGALCANELLGLRVGDCEAKGYGFDVTVSRDKTDLTNCFPVVLFAPLLANHLNHHPQKNVRDAPMWICRRGKNAGKALEYIGVNRLVGRLAKRAGIHRTVTAHFLRHTKVTWTYQQKRVRISDELACKMFRWKPGSAMPKRYAHLTGADGKEAMLALAGVEEVVTKIEKPSLLRPKKCFKCGEANTFDAKFCKACSTVLDREEAEKVVEKQRVIDDLFETLSDPEVRGWILEQIRKAKEEKHSP